MIANIVTWQSIRVATRRLALVGGVLAILGHTFRVMISLAIEARPGAAVNLPIVVTITLSFVGLALLGTATLRAKDLTGRAAWAPLLVLAGGLAAVPFHSWAARCRSESEVLPADAATGPESGTLVRKPAGAGDRFEGLAEVVGQGVGGGYGVRAWPGSRWCGSGVRCGRIS